MTTFIGTSASAPLGARAFYRITFERATLALLPVAVSSSGLLVGWVNYFSGFYERIARSGVFIPLSPNPVTRYEDAVATVDCMVQHGVETLSVAEGVRRLNDYGAPAVKVRTVQKLSGAADVQSGANNRQRVTDKTAAERDKANPITQLANMIGGAAQYLLFGVIALAAIRFSKGMK